MLAREVRAITNQDYRQINGSHILAASKALRHLRDLGLLVMKGSGSETFYQLVPQIAGDDDEAETQDGDGLTPHVSGKDKGFAEKDKGLTPYLCPKDKGFGLDGNGFLSFFDPFATGLDARMVRSGKLVYQYPDKPAHPQQAYKVPTPQN